MNPRLPKNVVAMTPGGAVTMDHIMGFLAMFNVPDEPVSAWKFQQQWIGKGLPAHLIPKARQPKHAFMRACSSIASRRAANGSTATEITADEIMETDEAVMYQVTQRVRDKANRVIEHPKAMRVTFEKATEEITWEPIERTLFDQEALDHLGEAIRAHYDKNAKKLPGPRVRARIRGLMDHLNGTNMRRKAGGVYFVPKDGKDDLDALADVLAELYGEEADLSMIPFVNADGEKNLLEKHFKIEVSRELDEMMAETTEALSADRKMRSDRAKNLLARRQVLANRRQSYADLLGRSLEEVNEKVELLDDQLEALVTYLGTD